MAGTILDYNWSLLEEEHYIKIDVKKSNLKGEIDRFFLINNNL